MCFEGELQKFYGFKSILFTMRSVGNVLVVDDWVIIFLGLGGFKRKKLC